ncbi:MAG: ribonuclease HI family protein [Deltaproteobacteria bacterium]|jgi:ribonuclease HI|nr:ribonuclease HI family protein [Deltaproteobacteria bacterium]
MKDSARFTLNTDGSSRGNPGHGGAGAVLVDSSGGKVFELGVYLGRVSNNAAEYQGLVLGLERALLAGARRVDILMDSELIVCQLNAEYRVKSPSMKSFFEKAQAMLDRLEDWTATHVPRAENAEADRLASRASLLGKQGKLAVGEDYTAPVPA